MVVEIKNYVQHCCRVFWDRANPVHGLELKLYTPVHVRSSSFLGYLITIWGNFGHPRTS